MATALKANPVKRTTNIIIFIKDLDTYLIKWLICLGMSD
jgi:hypothetical protein